MSSPSSSPDRRVLEELWLQRFSDAKLRLDFARNYVTEVKHDFLSPDIGADGNYAYRQALRAENAALSEYHRILRIFSDLTLRGIIPDEGEWLKTANAGSSETDTK